MVNRILEGLYYDSVRRALGGVPETVISNDDIDDQFIIGIAEAWVIKQVPDYASITDETDLLYLRSAVINYSASLLCPICAAKVKIEVKTIDTSWKKDKVNWVLLANNLSNKAVSSLSEIASVEVTIDGDVDSKIFDVAHTQRTLDGDY